MSKYTPWKQDSTKIYQDTTSSCFVKETRNSTQLALQTVKTEIRDTKIDCPSPTCLNWELTLDEISIKASGTCEATEERICTNNINGIQYTEKREVTAKCPEKKGPICTSWATDKTYQVSNSCFLLRKKMCTFQQISYAEYNETKINCTKGPVSPPITGKKLTYCEELTSHVFLYNELCTKVEISSNSICVVESKDNEPAIDWFLCPEVNCKLVDISPSFVEMTSCYFDL